MHIAVSVQAGLWGLLAGAALVVGAALAWFVKVPPRLIAGVMAFGSGVLISALAFELMDEAYARGGFGSTAIGFVAGAAVYTLCNWLLARHGARHRKRSQAQQPSESEDPGSGLAIAVFYALATLCGAVAPTLFAAIVESGDPLRLFYGYVFASGLMLAAAVVGLWLGVDSEGRSLEELR